jgi:hypothetical protein
MNEKTLSEVLDSLLQEICRPCIDIFSGGKKEYISDMIDKWACVWLKEGLLFDKRIASNEEKFQLALQHLKAMIFQDRDFFKELYIKSRENTEDQGAVGDKNNDS